MSQQIGWSQEAKLLYQLTQQMDRLIKVVAANGTTTTTTTATP